LFVCIFLKAGALRITEHRAGNLRKTLAFVASLLSSVRLLLHWL